MKYSIYYGYLDYRASSIGPYSISACTAYMFSSISGSLLYYPHISKSPLRVVKYCTYYSITRKDY